MSHKPGSNLNLETVMKVPSGGLGGIAGHNVTLLYPEDSALPLTLETGCSLNLHLPIKNSTMSIITEDLIRLCGTSALHVHVSK